MPRYYVFKGGPCGFAEDPELIVTADRTGAKLPERRSGSWKFLRAITPIRRSSDSVIVLHDSAMDAITREGYYRILREIPDLKFKAPFSRRRSVCSVVHEFLSSTHLALDDRELVRQRNRRPRLCRPAQLLQGREVEQGRAARLSKCCSLGAARQDPAYLLSVSSTSDQGRGSTIDE